MTINLVFFSAHLDNYVHKSGSKTSIIIIITNKYIEEEVLLQKSTIHYYPI